MCAALRAERGDSSVTAQDSQGVSYASISVTCRFLRQKSELDSRQSDKVVIRTIIFLQSQHEMFRNRFAVSQCQPANKLGLKTSMTTSQKFKAEQCFRAPPIGFWQLFAFFSFLSVTFVLCRTIAWLPLGHELHDMKLVQ
jgi:hypothetical protein